MQNKTATYLILLFGVDGPHHGDYLVLLGLHGGLAALQQPQRGAAGARVPELRHLLGRVARVEDQQHEAAVALRLDAHYGTTVTW